MVTVLCLWGKNMCISRPVQFKSMLFKGQLYFPRKNCISLGVDWRLLLTLSLWFSLIKCEWKLQMSLPNTSYKNLHTVPPSSLFWLPAENEVIKFPYSFKKICSETMETSEHKNSLNLSDHSVTVPQP